ncbi:integrase catalytic domain-containing protein [Trichonephila inaurata madagascariensis]|uniref:Integrase catalytic domain-containing protein n=1 Tax=Trichonephila inaurata madagascariensis TaxID=2747483 RepID=A0A8X6YXB7_9ARAC|nr:integrase catalytic domain-containing protein [Trichonephila inaurata madagascariensis]
MVMKNAVSGRATTDLPSLYDELESKIRALESLGRTQEKYGDYSWKDLQDLTPITPAMFLGDRPSSETTDLDMLDDWSIGSAPSAKSTVFNIQVGDIVLIGDDVKNRERERLQLPLARIIELIPGKDGLVRTVRVKTQHSILVRPIQRIFPLEASGSDFQELLNPPADSSMKTLDNDVNLPQVSRFRREIKSPNRL